MVAFCCLCIFAVAMPHVGNCVTVRPDQDANFDGLGLMKIDQYQKAIEKFTIAIETVPKERRESLSTYYINRSLAYRKLERLQEALADLDKALALEADNASAWSSRANILYKLERFAEVETDASKALLINPHEFVALNARGLAEAAQGRFDDAISDYTRALALKQDSIVYNNRASSYQQKKLWDEALSDYETALQIKPNDSLSTLGRASIQWQMKRFDAVINGSDAVLKESPKSDNENTALLRLTRGLAFHSKSRWTDAMAEYEASLRKNPNLVVTSALRELASLQTPVEFQKANLTSSIPLPQTSEIRLKGVLKSVDKAGAKLVLEAREFTIPSGKTAFLSAPKEKEITFDEQTQIVPFVGQTRKGNIEDIGVGTTISVVGPDKGTGASLRARWLGAEQPVSTANSLTQNTKEEPKLSSQAVGHPRFIKKDGQIWSAGTAFFTSDKEGKPLLLTAHHLLGPSGGLAKEIPASEVAAQIKTVRFSDLENRFVSGSATQTVSLTPMPPTKSAADESGDMEAFRFTPEAGQEIPTLPLAAENAKFNESLWLVGRAIGEKRPGDKGLVLYPARAVLSEDKRLVIQLRNPVAVRGFSGAPVVNARGEVVGMLLSSSGWLDVNFFICNPVSAMRMRLNENDAPVLTEDKL